MTLISRAMGKEALREATESLPAEEFEEEPEDEASNPDESLDSVAAA
jgi:hypothetical protein